MPISRVGATIALQHTVPYHHFRSLSHRMAAEREGARPLHPHCALCHTEGVQLGCFGIYGRGYFSRFRAVQKQKKREKNRAQSTARYHPTGTPNARASQAPGVFPPSILSARRGRGLPVCEIEIGAGEKSEGAKKKESKESSLTLRRNRTPSSI